MVTTNIIGTENCQPRIFNADLGALPAALQPLTQHKRWVVWRWEESSTGNWTKVPYQTNARWKARSNDPSTWSTYETALAAFKARPGCLENHPRRVDGIGYVLTHAEGLLPSGIGALDLDDCRDPDTGVIAPWAQELVDAASYTYVEVTVSGTGLRIVGTVKGEYLDTEAKAPDGGEVEFYRNATRFITVTGRQISNGTELQNIDELINCTYEKFAGHALPPARPRSTPDKARSKADRSPPSDRVLAMIGDDRLQPEIIAEVEAWTAELKAAYAVIPNDDLPWKEWSERGGVLHAVTYGSEAGLAIFDEFSAKSDKYHREDVLERWRHWNRSPWSSREGLPNLHAESIFHWAWEAAGDYWWRAGNDNADEGPSTRTDDEEPTAKAEGPSTKVRLPLFVSEWLESDIKPLDRLLGDLLSTTSRVMVVGPTGLGKTMFGLAISFRIPQGEDFMHWKAHRPGRVLYIDGEMSNRQMKKRIQAELKRSGGVIPDGLCILNKEFFHNMPPLNTKLGQEWLDSFIIEEHGPFDLIIFDNIQSLLVGNVKDNEQWADTLPYVRDLTRRGIGQIWFHHTGFDESHSYGDKSREWQLDTVVMMERVRTQDDLAFRLTFPKARERCPENKADFEDVLLALRDDEWVSGPVVADSAKLSPGEKSMLSILVEISTLRPLGDGGVTQEEWYERCRAEGLGANRRANLSDWRRLLVKKGLVQEVNGRWHPMHEAYQRERSL